jgi:hypothetical protein
MQAHDFADGMIVFQHRDHEIHLIPVFRLSARELSDEVTW